MFIFDISDCSITVGMEYGTILDSQITASSVWNTDQIAERGRLNDDIYWWSAANNVDPQWIQVNFGFIRSVSGITLQGNGRTQWVTKYEATTSLDDGDTWVYLKDNQQNDRVRRYSYYEPITKRFLKTM